MQIAYFSNQFADAEGHGNARYARELHQAISNIDQAPQLHPIAAWSSMDDAALATLQARTGLQILPLGRRLTPLCWTLLNRPKLEGLLPKQVDLVHAVALGYPVATRKPLVVTVHDLGPLTHPQYFQQRAPWIMRRSLERALRNAVKFICVSQFTADELLRLGGAELARRIRVVPEGVDARFFRPAQAQINRAIDLPLDGSPYLLATGKISPRKNLPAVIRAFAAVAQKIPHHLVLVGGDGWQVQETYEAVQAGKLAGRVHFPGFVAEEQLRALYRGASAYVHPSLYEGFGLTVLEAMASGCPVISSAYASIPEVSGDAAILVDPTSDREIAAAIERVCCDDTLADELRGRGLQRAATFTWSRCAQQTTEVYREALA